MSFKKKVLDVYKGMVFSRCDNAEGLFYFSKDDFEGLNAERIEFKSKRGDTLRGYFYYYDVKIPDRVVLFEHGLGGGHTAYMREIELLAHHGFLVMAYDHTGCMDSDGENTNGLAQSLSDLDDAVSFLKAHPLAQGKKICVMGHSWGGFSTMNICALHGDLHAIVSMAGFISIDEISRQNFKGILSICRRDALELEKKANPDFYTYNAIDSLKATDIPVLLIYSDNDKKVYKKHHYDKLIKSLSDKENITFILEKGKGHNPNFSSDAVVQKHAFFKEFHKMKRKNAFRSPGSRERFINLYNWYAITEQDLSLWEKIIEHLEK